MIASSKSVKTRASAPRLTATISPTLSGWTIGSRPSTAGADRSPGELFGEYLGTRAVDDRRVEELFARLHDRVTDVSRGRAGEGH